ncbi:hypothetical protein Goari_027275 [Gossypium aridum]|uniref:DUF4283 domain-containing protein n=1 Tax=Gossypium aridum TaxID=34290 RepID=A0A7J8YPA1_GOSAI|nr:hypothetical protein [Gossypium aridum]
MEKDLVDLVLDDKEEEILQAQINPGSEMEEDEVSDLGEKRFLLKFFHKTDLEGVPLVFVNFWVQVHKVPPSFFNEALAKQLGDFLGTYLDDSFYPAKMALGVEIVELGWDLSLKAQSKKDCAISSVWLREEGNNINKGNNFGCFESGDRSWSGKKRVHGGISQSDMEHDSKDCAIERVDGKKKPIKDSDTLQVRKESNSLTIQNRKHGCKTFLLALGVIREITSMLRFGMMMWENSGSLRDFMGLHTSVIEMTHGACYII